jgi:membrane protein YdbS with pleckstrin-like domain
MLWQGRFSARAMIGPAAAMAVGSLALLILAIMIELATQGWLVVLGVILVAWIGLGLRLVYRQLSVHYYLTNQRLLHEQGLLWREVDRIEAIDIDDVSLQQGPVERMLGIGTVQIRSSDQSTPHFEIVGIEDARDLARRLDEVRRQERMRRGLHIESV